MSIFPKEVKIRGRKIPDTPGVYLMYGKNKNLLYVGKAGNLRRRVESYFSRVQNYRIQA